MASLAFLVQGMRPEAGSLVSAASSAASDARALRGAAHTLGASSPVVPAALGWTSLTTATIVAGAAGALVAARRRQLGRGSARSARSDQAVTACASSESPVVLEVRDFHALSTDDEHKQILKGLNLTVREGEVHAVMGPNGSGKSTLSKVLIGDGSYEVTAGEAVLGGKNLFELEPHERALEGLFLAFQSPPAVNGVSNLDFLRAAYNAQRRAREEPELDVIEFYGLCSGKLDQLRIDPDFLNRNVNDGFSGGERKRNEMLQMSVLEPRLAILDEIDSGLDVDALKDVADAIARVRKADTKRAMIMVTHFERFLKYVDPDFVHVMYKGRIIKSGGRELGHKLDEEGYDWVIAEETEKQRLLQAEAKK